MNIQEKILADDAFVIEETKKLQYLYGLKNEIRYNATRAEEIETESVAEHVYGMHILATYFLLLEDEDKKMDWQKVFEMVTFHDIDEVETGDMIGYLKTPEIRANETTAALRVIGKSPTVIKERVSSLLHEYDELKSAEAIFVKAIDRIEPIFHLLNENGRKIIKKNHTTREQSDSIKRAYVESYPYMKRFFEVLSDQMEKESYYQ